MKSTVEPLEGNKVKLSIEVDETEFDKAIDAAFRKIAREVRIPGFRPGQGAPPDPRGPPRCRGRSRPGAARFAAGVLRRRRARARRRRDRRAGDRDHRRPGRGPGRLRRRRRGPAPHRGAGLRRPPGRGAPPRGHRRGDRRPGRPLREQFAELAEVDRAVPGRRRRHHQHPRRGGRRARPRACRPTTTPTGSAPAPSATSSTASSPGAKIGDALAFDGELAGTDRDVSFRVLVKKVQERVLPEVTDEWANEVSEFDTVEELRADLADRLANVRKLQASLALREKTVEALVQLVERRAARAARPAGDEPPAAGPVDAAVGPGHGCRASTSPPPAAPRSS